MDFYFGPTGVVTWWQECNWAVLVFFYGWIIIRIAGRRTFGKWSALDIIVAVVVGSSLSRALTGTVPLFGTLAAVTLLMILHWLLAQAVARSKPLSRLIEGQAIDLAVNGKMRPARVRDGVSGADIGEAPRQSGIERIEDTARVTLEPSGKITVLRSRN